MACAEWNPREASSRGWPLVGHSRRTAGGGMHERERHRLILKAVRERPFVTTQEIMELTEASAATVRRDVAALHLKKALRRVRGGAEALSPTQQVRLSGRPFEVNQSINARHKRAIAERAAMMCSDGEAVIINGGTTTFQMVHFLDDRRLQVLTNSFPIAEFLLRQTGHTVSMPGGTIYREQGVMLTPFENDVSGSCGRFSMNLIPSGS